MKLIHILKEITIQPNQRICYVGADETPAKIIKGPVNYLKYKNEIDTDLLNADWFPENERAECSWYYVEFLESKRRYWWNRDEIEFETLLN